ncbi:MAG: HD domain-containing phosphohydrolase [Bacillota bacterium]
MRSRLAIASLFLTLFLLSFKVEVVRKYIYELSRFFAFVAVAHLIFIAFLDDFRINYIFSLIIVIILINLIFAADGRLKIYNLVVCLFLVTVLYAKPEMFFDRGVIFLSFVIFAFLSYFLSRYQYNIEQKWKLKSNQYETIFDNSNDAIFLVDVADGEFKYRRFNKSHEKLTGLKTADARGKTPQKFLPEKVAEDVIFNYRKCVERKETINYREKLSLPDTTRYWDTTLSPVFEDGEVVQLVGNSRDITEQIKAEKKVKQKSYRDELTGLYNRRYFEENIDRYDIADRLPLGIIVSDVNSLKLVNDAFGHKEGDKLLQTIAGVLKDSCRCGDLICRWGGDEFVVLLPRISGKEAGLVAGRIKQSLREVEAEPVEPSIAIGYACKTEIEEDFDDIFKKAEDWMYKRKLNESKNRHGDILLSLKETLYQSSHENYEHCQRLKQMVRRLGESLDLSEEKLEDLEMLAEIHDIGKVAVPGEIVEKRDQLAPEEREKLEEHPEIGYQIAKTSSQLARVAEGILHHHEKWDGSGYPQQLKGEEIPLLSRILHVVNEYDKMINYHPHVELYSKREAVKKMKENAGTKFDPELVDLFINEVLKDEVN